MSRKLKNFGNDPKHFCSKDKKFVYSDRESNPDLNSVNVVY